MRPLSVTTLVLKPHFRKPPYHSIRLLSFTKRFERVATRTCCHSQGPRWRLKKGRVEGMTCPGRDGSSHWVNQKTIMMLITVNMLIYIYINMSMIDCDYCDCCYDSFYLLLRLHVFHSDGQKSVWSLKGGQLLVSHPSKIPRARKQVMRRGFQAFYFEKPSFKIPWLLWPSVHLWWWQEFPCMGVTT